jgi:uncharacterized membrane protein
MSHSHAHHARRSHVPANPIARAVLLGFLGIWAFATIVGMVVLFPSSDAKDRPKADFASPGVTFPSAKVNQVHPICDDQPQASGGSTGSCAEIDVTLQSGASAGERLTVQIPPEVAQSGLRSGDVVELQYLPSQSELPGTYQFFGVKRGHSILLMTILFIVVVTVVARARGLLAVVGLGLAGVVVVKFMLPALLQGQSGIGVAIVASSIIMFAVLYLAHGVSVRTSAALAGTLLGVGLTALLAQIAVGGARLSGIGNEESGILGAHLDLNFQGLLTCAIIVASLGILNDVTITQVSAIWELRDAAPEMPRRALFNSGMRIGRDHIASTIYTIVFAYAGAALSILLLLELYDRPWFALLSSEAIGEEVIRVLAGSIGLVLAVPITTLIAVATTAAPSLRSGSD